MAQPDVGDTLSYSAFALFASADRSEAEAWMQGSSQFGKEVVGIKDSKYGKAGEQGRDLSEGADRGGGGSGGEAREYELAGRSRLDSELQLPLPLHGRD